MDAMIRQSKDWLKTLHMEDSRKRYRIQTAFPSVRDVLNKIRSYCSSINLHILDVTQKVAKIATQAKPTTISETTLRAKDVESNTSKPKALTKARTMPRTLAKWDDDNELEFPALITSKSNHHDSQMRTEAEKTHTGHSCKSTMETIDIKEEATKSVSEVFVSLIVCNEDATHQSSNKMTSTRSHGNISSKSDHEDSESQKAIFKNSKGFDGLITQGHKELSIGHKERSSKSAEKESILLRSPKSQKSLHCSGTKQIEKKLKESDGKFSLNKTSIDRLATAFVSCADVSEFELDLNSSTRPTVPLGSLNCRQKDLTNLDIKILETMEKFQKTFERKTSRYKFAATEGIEVSSAEESLIESFLEIDLMDVKHSVPTHKQTTHDLKEFRLFNQSYTLPRLTKSS